MISWSSLCPPRNKTAIARNLFLSLIALTSLPMFSTSPASAEESLSIKQMKVSVYPEYDEPRVLVMSQGAFDGPLELNKKVSFKLPKGADIKEVCGLKKPNDEHLCQLYETRQEEDGIVLTYNLPVRDFYFEFYYNPLQGTGTREIDYSFTGTYKIESLEVEVQQPLRSTDFKLQPETNQTSTEGQGFKLFRYSFAKVEPGKPFAVKLSYAKQDANPSVPKKAPGGQTSSGGGPETNTLLIVFVIAGGLAAAGFFIAMRRSPSRPTPTMAYAAYGPGGGSRNPGKKASKSRARFCPGCGAPVGPDDAFCHYCGAKIRKGR